MHHNNFYWSLNINWVFSSFGYIYSDTIVCPSALSALQPISMIILCNCTSSLLTQLDLIHNSVSPKGPTLILDFLAHECLELLLFSDFLSPLIFCYCSIKEGTWSALRQYFFLPLPYILFDLFSSAFQTLFHTETPWGLIKMQFWFCGYEVEAKVVHFSQALTVQGPSHTLRSKALLCWGDLPWEQIF